MLKNIPLEYISDFVSMVTPGMGVLLPVTEGGKLNSFSEEVVRSFPTFKKRYKGGAMILDGVGFIPLPVQSRKGSKPSMAIQEQGLIHAFCNVPRGLTVLLVPPLGCRREGSHMALNEGDVLLKVRFAYADWCPDDVDMITTFPDAPEFEERKFLKTLWNPKVTRPEVPVW